MDIDKLLADSSEETVATKETVGKKETKPKKKGKPRGATLL